MATGAKKHQTYAFGPFRLDSAERLLLRDGQPIPLTPKAFDLLVFLVEHHGHLVEKSALMSALWPDTAVEETNLAYNVSALRKVLDEAGGEASAIQTVATRGYRFVAQVSETSGALPTRTSQRRRLRVAAASVLVTSGIITAVLLTTRAPRSPVAGTGAPRHLNTS